MRIKYFNKLLTKLFKDLEIKNYNLQLFGSFNSSIWASDIDLYEPVSVADVPMIQRKIKLINRQYILQEVKVVNDGKKKKYSSQPPIILRNNLEMIKIDFVVLDLLPYPIEVSVIYDFEHTAKRDSNEIIKDLVMDVKDPTKSMFKRVKRLASIARLQGRDTSRFDNITEDARIGIVYLSNDRIKMLRNIRSIIGEKLYNKYTQWIHEDLRKYGLKMSDDLQKYINTEVTKRLSLLKTQ